MSSKLIRRLGSEAVIYGLAGTISRFINVFLIPVYTRVFTPEEYGLFGIVTSFVALLTLLLTMLDNAAARWFFEYEETEKRKSVISSWFWFQIALGTLLALLSIVFAQPLAGFVLGSQAYGELIALAALFVLVSIFGKVISNWLRYQRRPFAMMIYAVASSLTTTAIIILLVVYLHRGLIGVYWGQLVGGVLTAIVSAFILRDWISIRKTSREVLTPMLRFGLPVMVATIASWFTLSADRFIMPFYVSTAEIGMYFLAFQLASLMGLADTAFQLAWGPFALSILHRPEANAVYSRVLSLYSFFGSWAGVILALLAPAVLSTVSTPAYAQAADSMSYLIFFFLGVGLTNVAGIGAFIAKKPGPIATNIYISASVSVVLTFVLLPLMGTAGAALAKLVGVFAAVIYVYLASQKLYHIPYKPFVAISCFGAAWAIILLSNLLVPKVGVTAVVIRSFMSVLFIPLGFALGIFRPAHIHQIYVQLRHRFIHAAV